MIGSGTQIDADGVSEGQTALMTGGRASLSSAAFAVLGSTVAEDGVFLAGLFRTKVSNPGLLNMMLKVQSTGVEARTFRQSLVGGFNRVRR